MIAYLGKFIVNLSETTAPLRKLLEKDTLWSFDKPQQDAFDTLKDLVTKAPVLKYFDPQIAHKNFVRCVEVGSGSYTGTMSRRNLASSCLCLTVTHDSRENYCQLEKETLSILFASDRFHEYLYGRKFQVINDHQPLRSIFRKPLNKSPPRIQRFDYVCKSMMSSFSTYLVNNSTSQML